MNQIFQACLFVLFAFSSSYSYTQEELKEYWEYPQEYDFPKNVVHGTYDFDEWPGVGDDSIVYKSIFSFNTSKNDRYKIDYMASSFGEHSHEGYLKTKEEMEERGFIDIEKFFAEKFDPDKDVVILAIFAHPDDETLLAGGFFSWAKRKGYKTNLVLISNGAASIDLMDANEMKKNNLRPNAFGVRENGTEVTQYDNAGKNRVENLYNYGTQFLRLDNIEILKMNQKVNSEIVTEFGETSNMDYLKTYGPQSKYRSLLLDRMLDVLSAYSPDVVLTHGSNGEYGHYLHIVTNLVVNQAMSLINLFNSSVLMTCMPEYNIDDKITHFLELDEDTTLNDKWNAILSIPEIYQPDKDFDKPWDPIQYPNGVFMKDYGYSPIEAKPPKYEFFKIVGE
jgi:LmbE family N-acetylglucosaminyl deacetylase